MCRFIESICCSDGDLKLLDLHQERVNKTFLRHFTGNNPIQLSKITRDAPPQGRYKCRIEYGKADYQVEYLPYQIPDIKSLKLVDGGDINYPFKSTNRTSLTGLYDQRDGADDIIIVKEGQLTDSYFANLAFYDGSSWFTPKHPLLKGVKREHLIKKGKLIVFDIQAKDLDGFQEVSLINAMLDLGQVSVPIKKIKKI